MPTYIADAISGFFNTYGTYMLFGALAIGLVLLMIIPQRKREKQIRNMLSSISVGDKVRTVGGIVGTVRRIDENTVTITSGPTNAQMTLNRASIATVANSSVENTISDDVQISK